MPLVNALSSAPTPNARDRASTTSSRGLANGADMVGTVIVFFLVGFGLDAWLNTTPWFMVILTVVGIIGTFVRTWYAYSAEMDRLDAERRAPRTETGSATPEHSS